MELSHKAEAEAPRTAVVAPAGSLLLVSVLGSLGTALGSVLVLEPEDRISVPRGMWITLMGAIFFVSLFDFMNYIMLNTLVGHRFMKKYDLQANEVKDLSNKTVSAVQAWLSCLAGTVICWWSCNRDFLCTSHYMSDAYAWFGSAYFLYDIWSMYHVWTHNTSCINLPKDTLAKVKVFAASQPLIIAHHLFIGVVGFLIIVYFRGDLGDCMFGFVYLMELSTPFVSIRVVLSKLKMKTSRLYLYNGLSMLFTFLLCRIVMFPYVGLLYSNSIKKPFWQAMWNLPWGAKAVIPILLVPQIYWFYLMLLGALNLILSAIRPS